MTNLFNVGLVAFALLSPVLFLPLNVPGIPTLQFHQFGYFSNSIEFSQQQLFIYAVALLFAFSFFANPQRFLKERIVAFLFLLYLSSVVAHPRTIKQSCFIIAGFALYHMVVTYARVSFIKKIFWAVLAVSLFNLLCSLIQIGGGNFILASKGKEIFGFMCYKTHLGIYQAIAIPICYALNPRLVVIPVVGLLLSGSCTAIISAIIGCWYFFRKKLATLQSPPLWLCFFTVLGLFIYKSFSKISIRIPVWIDAIKDGSLFGKGVGTFNFIIERGAGLHNIVYSDPYSIYLQVFHDLGIVGFVMVLVFLIGKFYNFNTKNRSYEAVYTVCLILSIAGIMYSFFDYPRLAGTAILMFGLLSIVVRESKIEKGIL